MVPVRNDKVAALLIYHLMARQAVVGDEGPLFAFNADTFRRRFKSTCKLLGLTADYVPHSLRHGGATHDFMMGVPIDTIMHHGRWAATKTARHYIQAGRSLLLDTKVPAGVAAIARLMLPHIMPVFTLTQRH